MRYWRTNSGPDAGLKLGDPGWTLLNPTMFLVIPTLATNDRQSIRDGSQDSPETLSPSDIGSSRERT
jgi:hypothetical protein